MGATKKMLTANALEMDIAAKQNNNSTVVDDSIPYSPLTVDTALSFPVMVPRVMFVLPLLFSVFFFLNKKNSFRVLSVAYFGVWFSHGYPRIFNILFFFFNRRILNIYLIVFKLFILVSCHFFIHFRSALSKDLFGKWEKLDDSCFSVETISGGITNLREQFSYCCLLYIFVFIFY